jgi:hypothetical protein
MMENDKFLCRLTIIDSYFCIYRVAAIMTSLDLWCVISVSNILVNALSAFVIPQNNGNTGMRLPRMGHTMK